MQPNTLNGKNKLYLNYKAYYKKVITSKLAKKEDFQSNEVFVPTYRTNSNLPISIESTDNKFHELITQKENSFYNVKLNQLQCNLEKLKHASLNDTLHIKGSSHYLTESSSYQKNQPSNKR